MLSYPFHGSSEDRLCAFDDFPDNLGCRLFLVHHCRDLPRKEAAVLHVAILDGTDGSFSIIGNDKGRQILEKLMKTKNEVTMIA